MKKNLSLNDLIIIGITLILFTIALFTKGLTHDLLLEAGVLLVSIKLILMNYKNNLANKLIIKQLNEINEILSDFKK